MSDLVLKWLAFAVGLLSAATAAFSLYRNTRTKAAEFLVSLHRGFFIDPLYQPMKTLLDCDGAEEEARLEEAVRSESGEFTDFLNFFELVAYLQEAGTLSAQDVDALLGYYLDKLRTQPAVWAYIRQSTKSFENLRRLLADRPLQ